MKNSMRFILAAMFRLFGVILAVIGVVSAPFDGALIVVGTAMFIEGVIIYWKEY